MLPPRKQEWPACLRSLSEAVETSKCCEASVSDSFGTVNCTRLRHLTRKAYIANAAASEPVLQVTWVRVARPLSISAIHNDSWRSIRWSRNLQCSIVPCRSIPVLKRWYKHIDQGQKCKHFVAAYPHLFRTNWTSWNLLLKSSLDNTLIYSVTFKAPFQKKSHRTFSCFEWGHTGVQGHSESRVL